MTLSGKLDVCIQWYRRPIDKSINIWFCLTFPYSHLFLIFGLEIFGIWKSGIDIYNIIFHFFLLFGFLFFLLSLLLLLLSLSVTVEFHANIPTFGFGVCYPGKYWALIPSCPRAHTLHTIWETWNEIMANWYNLICRCEESDHRPDDRRPHLRHIRWPTAPHHVDNGSTRALHQRWPDSFHSNSDQFKSMTARRDPAALESASIRNETNASFLKN